MSQLIYRNSIEITGLFRATTADLRDLDVIVQRHVKELRTARKRAITHAKKKQERKLRRSISLPETVLHDRPQGSSINENDSFLNLMLKLLEKEDAKAAAEFGVILEKQREQREEAQEKSRVMAEEMRKRREEHRQQLLKNQEELVTRVPVNLRHNEANWSVSLDQIREVRKETMDGEEKEDAPQFWLALFSWTASRS
jgi:hypothetical protein